MYVYSGAAGAGTGADWANAYTTLSAALAAKAAGDDFWVAHDHAESTAGAVTLTSPGTAASPCRIVCVSRAGSTPPVSADLATTATVATTGNNSINYSGHAYCRGVGFTAGNSTGTASNIFAPSATTCWTFESCSLKCGSTGASGRISSNTGSSSGLRIGIALINTNVEFSAVGQTFAMASADFLWRGGSLAGSTFPTTLFSGATVGFPCRATLLGVDLSNLGSGKTIFGIGDNACHRYTAVDCKLGSSVAIAGGTPPGPGGCEVRAVNCDSADTNYRYYYQDYNGTITQETTIVRSGGASDGTTTFSRKMVTTANSKFYSPLKSDWISFWNETTGSGVTITIPVITDGVTLKDNEAWVEVEYLGTSGFPLGVFASDAAADVLNAGTNQTTDSGSTWTTTGLSSPVKQSLAVTFTPQEKGLVRARVCLAKASTTMYFDPKAE